ncbi:helix-turn-helix domain-containing protein [Streptomyces sp. M41]|uniref:helix-turn-helix domain-containing protein n=1 Tax=Streptomyces sp. M41 TaxID=3059412 RepID=UPI00374DED0E
MGAWQPLPDDLPPEVRHFVEQLRQLKDRTALSLVALGARTAYSKSSWQRYLNATQPPPREAVAALCRVAGIERDEAERFGVRWELAVRAWPKPATAPARPERGRGAGQDRGEESAQGEIPGESGAGGVSGVSGVSRTRGTCGDVEELEEYEDEPTLPWWDVPPQEPQPPSRRLLVVTLALVVALALTGVIGALALG